MMDHDDPSPVRADDPLATLARQDLDALSVGELDRRIALLHAEIARTQAKRVASDSVRSAADALFRRG